MRKAYTLLAWGATLGTIVLCSLYAWVFNALPSPLLFLPITCCFIVAAVLDRKLPPEERDNSWRSLFSRQQSPIFYAIAATTMNIFLFFPDWDNSVLQWILFPLICIVIITAVVDLWAKIKGPPKIKGPTKRELKRRKNRPPKEDHK